ncbi:MAG: hypothetical protein ACTSYU_01275 [Promethearchaeota archaeon]
MKNPIVNLVEHIFFIDIGEDSNTDIFKWKQPNSVLFRMDVIAARAEASEDYFRRQERSNVRIMFIKKDNLVFTIGSDDTIQYQLLEAILESVMEEFLQTYGMFSYSLSGLSNLFEGFQDVILKLFETVQRDRVTWVLVPCKLCKISHALCINKTLIEKAPSFPISIVYLHKGIGLTVYIDAHMKVRGVEPVTITG